MQTMLKLLTIGYVVAMALGAVMIVLVIVHASRNNGDPGVITIPTGDGTMVVIPTSQPGKN